MDLKSNSNNKLVHNKLRNTGLLFELLTRSLTSDTMSGKESPALSIIKKHFVKTELGREYKLYETLLKNKNLSEGKANIIINAIIEKSGQLNKGTLRREKYNLIREIKDNYDLNEFFKIKLPNYKANAALYILIEAANNKEIQLSTNQIITNRTTLLEHLVSKPVTNNQAKQEDNDDILEEFKTYDKDLRILTYRVILEKFNDKYSSLNNPQKLVLKEFIESMDSTPQLKEFYNTKINEIKTELKSLIIKVKDKTTKIKLNEINNILVPLNKMDKIGNENLVDLLSYYQLLEEIKKVKA